MHSANVNLASNYDRNIIHSPFSSPSSPLSHCVKTPISELPTYASFGGGGSHMSFCSEWTSVLREPMDHFDALEKGNTRKITAAPRLCATWWSDNTTLSMPASKGRLSESKEGV